MVDIPWPNIRTQVNEDTARRKVPLQEDYAFNDMWYLDTKEAQSIFEFQATLIKEHRSKGIVDVGCRHGPVLKYLDHDFNYMGFDTSVEPIELASEAWKNNENIEFRCKSWNNLETFVVDFKVDTVIFSGVLLYRKDHFEFFEWVMDFYKAKHAIIQEPYHNQRHWDDTLILNTITNDLEQYRNKYKCEETLLDCEIFAGKRLIINVTL
jgi:SAM-dependent methyltransferase